jgi:microcystin-dependent protein
MWPGSINDLPNSPFDYWIPCQGQTLSKTTYPGLFTILGYTYGGTGDNFNVPDMRNLFVTGAGDTYNLSATGGSANAVLPAHTHAISGGSASGTFITALKSESVNQGGGGGVSVADELNPTTGSVSYTEPSAGTTGLDNTGNDSTTQTVTNANLPPYIALHYIIRIQ